jgi:hypothetical protein
MARQNDPSIPGWTVLLRRIPPKADRVTWAENGLPIPSSQNFKDKRYDEISVYMANETSPEAVLRGHNGFGLAYFTVQDVRDAAAEFRVAIMICRDEEEPEPGHVVICGKITNGMATKIKALAKWVEGRWPARLSPDAW